MQVWDGYSTSNGKWLKQGTHLSASPFLPANKGMEQERKIVSNPEIFNQCAAASHLMPQVSGASFATGYYCNFSQEKPDSKATVNLH